MDFKIDPLILNGQNYAFWELELETLLNSKRLWQCTNTAIPNPEDDQMKFIINGKEYCGHWGHYDCLGNSFLCE